jgi:hypothetical protein
MPAVAHRKRPAKLPKISELSDEVSSAQVALLKARRQAVEGGLRRLQATLTPAVLEHELPGMRLVYRRLLELDRKQFIIPDDLEKAINECHRRMVQSVAFLLFFRGDVDASRARVLRDLVEIMQLGGIEPHRGWTLDKDGVPIEL